MMSKPKTIINGFAIWDVRYADPRSGWYISCANEDHIETFAYSYRLDNAKAEAMTMTCVGCKAGA